MEASNRGLVAEGAVRAAMVVSDRVETEGYAASMPPRR
jgi:hypothetical protein